MNEFIFAVDDDDDVCMSLQVLLETNGYHVLTFSSAEDFLEAASHRDGACLIIDIYMRGMTGLELLQHLRALGSDLPVIVVTGHGDIPLAIKAMKAGAFEFLQKPLDPDLLMEAVARAIEKRRQEHNLCEEAATAQTLLSNLTPRELDVFDQLVAGLSNKLAAEKLAISPRTVEVHRARIMEKLQARSLSDLVKTAIAASRRMAARHRDPAH